jgi:hypothetical protein
MVRPSTTSTAGTIMTVPLCAESYHMRCYLSYSGTPLARFLFSILVKFFKATCRSRPTKLSILIINIKMRTHLPHNCYLPNIVFQLRTRNVFIAHSISAIGNSITVSDLIKVPLKNNYRSWVAHN